LNVGLVRQEKLKQLQFAKILVFVCTHLFFSKALFWIKGQVDDFYWSLYFFEMVHIINFNLVTDIKIKLFKFVLLSILIKKS